MFEGLLIASLIGTCTQLIKEAHRPLIPAENWKNKELAYQDQMKIPEREFTKNLVNGKYRILEKYPEPHKDSNGKIIIENSLLHQRDLRNYGPYQVEKWVKQGKYNLSPEELKKEHERIKKENEYMYKLL